MVRNYLDEEEEELLGLHVCPNAPRKSAAGESEKKSRPFELNYGHGLSRPYRAVTLSFQIVTGSHESGQIQRK